MSSPSAEWWVDDLQDVCIQFQLDLSCLVDGELDEVAGGRAIAHLEECASCSTFFNDARSQIRKRHSNRFAHKGNGSGGSGIHFDKK